MRYLRLTLGGVSGDATPESRNSPVGRRNIPAGDAR